MAEQLGSINKPEAEQFAGKKKICIVPLLFSGDSAPPDYVEKFNLYWEQIVQQLANLESRIGKVSHIYYESITQSGENALKLIEKMNPPSCKIVKDKCQRGATLEVTEDKELAEEAMDWERFILMGFISQTVARKVSESYVEASRKRYEQIAGKIDDTLKENEAGILFIREDHMVQFPGHIEVFSVSPPALDDIHRWQRDRSLTDKAGKPEEPGPENSTSG